MNLFPSEEDFIDVHTHNTETQLHVYNILNVFLTDFPDIPSTRPLSIGLHPWHIDQESHALIESTLHEAASLSYVIAIGETGLDKVVRIPLARQIEIFKKHIIISEEVKKPLIIHCVKAYQELMGIKKSVKPSMPWILHGYHGSEELISDLLKQEFYFSMNEWIIKNPDKAKSIIERIPMDFLLLETDEYQANISDIYFLTSILKKMELNDLKIAIAKNFYSAFLKK